MVLKLGRNKCFITCSFLLEGHTFCHSCGVLSLELAFLLYLKHVYQTLIRCLLRLQVVVWE